MTRAKLGVFIVADGFDSMDGAPLVRIMGDDPEQVHHHVRIGIEQTDIRSRPMWRNWSMVIRMKFDADMFNLQDVTNLLARVGEQCGLGEGRPNSRKSTGMGWGTFRIAGPGEVIDYADDEAVMRTATNALAGIKKK